jgi:hypothetical protein
VSSGLERRGVADLQQNPGCGPSLGKGGDIATNRRDEQELSVLCLRVLQAALVYVNTLMVQDILADDEWAAQLTDADRRGLTPLFRTHVASYGEVELDMTSRLVLDDRRITQAKARVEGCGSWGTCPGDRSPR